MFLGLDLGTSSLKAMLVDEEQKVVAVQSVEMSVSRPHSGWSEQEPQDWVNACNSVMSALAETAPVEVARIQGIGVAGHMHGATLIDATDKVLRPCMLWNDTRSHSQASYLDADPQFRLKAGNIVFPGFTAPKVEWVRQNESEIFNKVAKILLPKDFLRLWLTGEHVSEMSDASGTAWLDVAKRDWSNSLLDACQLSRDQMPRLVEGTAASGDLRRELAKKWGIDGPVVVAGGAGDNAAAAIGVGATQNGDAFVSLGTSGVLFAANDAYRPKPESAVHTFCHALPETWHQMGVILSATDALNWFARIAGTDAKTLTKELGKTLKGPSDVTFLPYLSGERTPHNDATIRGSFSNISQSSDRSDMTRAVLDGVAFALADNLDALHSTGTRIERVLAVGGGSRSQYWLETIATVLDVHVDVPQGGDFGAAFGAARLGMISATGRHPADICKPPSIEATITPNKDMQNAYRDAREQFRATYPALKSLAL